jgi:hypothetical protein
VQMDARMVVFHSCAFRASVQSSTPPSPRLALPFLPSPAFFPRRPFLATADGITPAAPPRCGAPWIRPRAAASAGSGRDDAMTRDTLSTLDLSERPGQRVIWIRRVPHYQVDGPVELRPGERPFAAGPHHDAYICMVESEDRLEAVTTTGSISVALRGGARP